MCLPPKYQIPAPTPVHRENINEKGPMKLRVESKKDGYEMWLDDKRIHHIESYKIESSPYRGKAELSLKLLVRYPVTQENDL